MNTNKYSSYFNSESTDFTILFLTNTKLTQYSSIHDAVTSFKSSLAFPYGYFTDSIEILISSTLTEMDNVKVSGDFMINDASSIDINNAKDLISSGNCKDIIVIDLRNNDNINDIISTFNDLIQTQNGQIIIMDISTNKKEEIHLPKSNKAYRSMKQILDSTDGTYPTRFPGYIIQGLFVSFLLILIAVVGIICSCQIQSPEEFEKPMKYKE